MQTRPKRKVPKIPRREIREVAPVFRVRERIEQNTARGVIFMMMPVIRRNKSLQASKSSLRIRECSPISPVAIPHRTARNKSCSMLPSTKGLKKLDGTIPTIRSVMDRFSG